MKATQIDIAADNVVSESTLKQNQPNKSIANDLAIETLEDISDVVDVSALQENQPNEDIVDKVVGVDVLDTKIDMNCQTTTKSDQPRSKVSRECFWEYVQSLWCCKLFWQYIQSFVEYIQSFWKDFDGISRLMKTLVIIIGLMIVTIIGVGLTVYFTISVQREKDVVCSFNCNKEGTIGGICESNTGHGICVCKDNWSGDLCDTCNDGWYRYDSDAVWRGTYKKNDKCLHECKCNDRGINGCDKENGKCTCEDGWHGSHCSYFQCRPGEVCCAGEFTNCDIDACYPSCQECPQGNGTVWYSNWCNGDCQWSGGKCKQRKGEKCLGRNDGWSKDCALPFKFKGKIYEECTTDDSKNGVPWCPLEIDNEGNLSNGTWGFRGECDPGCPGNVEVSCGEHNARSCAGCPQGNGESWCNGDCQWIDDGPDSQCVEKTIPELGDYLDDYFETPECKCNEEGSAHGAMCNQDLRSKSCTCKDGWFGDKCEYVICKSSEVCCSPVRDDVPWCKINGCVQPEWGCR